MQLAPTQLKNIIFNNMNMTAMQTFYREPSKHIKFNIFITLIKDLVSIFHYERYYNVTTMLNKILILLLKRSGDSKLMKVLPKKRF